MNGLNDGKDRERVPCNHHVGKKQKNTLEALLEHMRMRAQLSQSVSERCVEGLTTCLAP